MRVARRATPDGCHEAPPDPGQTTMADPTPAKASGSESAGPVKSFTGTTGCCDRSRLQPALPAAGMDKHQHQPPMGL